MLLLLQIAAELDNFVPVSCSASWTAPYVLPFLQDHYTIAWNALLTTVRDYPYLKTELFSGDLWRKRTQLIDKGGF